MTNQFQQINSHKTFHDEMGFRRNVVAQALPRVRHDWLLYGVLLLSVLLSSTATAQRSEPLVEPSPMVTRLLADDLLTETQRREAAIFHGRWDLIDEPTPTEALALRVARYEVPAEAQGYEALVAEMFADKPPSAREVMLLARAGQIVGLPELVQDADIQAGQGVSRQGYHVLQAKALEDTGQYAKAIELLAPIRAKALEGIDELTSAADLTAAAEAVMMLAHFEGRPAADFHLANQLLSKARNQADPLYWPAYVAEARLLWSKGNPQQAFEAVLQALSLNPKSSEAWYLFGSMRARFFDFDAANRAVKELHAINETHPLADVLAIEIALRQKDVATAEKVIQPALERYPTHRKLLALRAAVQAMAYDDDAKRDALAAFAKLAPGNPLAEFLVGRSLNDARQYALAEPHLKHAIAMLPGWSEPQLELGELYVQWGKLDQAAAQLQLAASLDPFHKRINNQLTLVNEMLGYATIQTDQFVVRYLPGIDEVLARDVAMHMGDMVKQFIERFEHDPPSLTQVDLMPDDQHFAVRVTGMPSVWTIAACTGDVIAMTPPRPGPKRSYGAYNWLNVMGHEYAHVVNLSQTNNRVPHWFTEGCAVNMETTGRLWSQYQLLADCYNNDKLFEYDQINWGFIRPTEDFHRPLAYAQSAWIKEYVEKVHGWDKAITMLDLYQQGVGEHEVIRRVFDLEPDAFMQRFLKWAEREVEAWGMSSFAVKPEDQTLAAMLSIDDPGNIDLDQLNQLIEKHPDEPALLKLRAQVSLASDDDPAAQIAHIKRFQSARPVDPWSDRQLARLALKTGDNDTAIQALRALDRIEADAPEYAVELARVYRARKDYDQALHFAEQALLREPYNATYRETAATLAMQGRDLARAAFHIESLALLEPNRAIHAKRLAAIYKLMGQPDKAAAAKQRAETLESK